jgi:hypothetical protein
MNFKYSFMLPVIASVIVLNCTSVNKTEVARSEKPDPGERRPAFPGYAPVPSEIIIDSAEMGRTVNLINGTVLVIPSGAFVYENGRPVTGKVKLIYNEYRDAADIILSGINMSYDSAGTTYSFQTAGMFDLNGYQADKQVFVAEGKTLSLRMKSDVTETSYNFYEADSAGRWKYSGACKMEINETDGSRPAILMPLKPLAYDPNGHIIDLKIDAENYPELSSLKGLMWQYAGSDVQKDLVSKTWIYAEHWREIKVTETDREQSLFRLSLKSGSKSYSIPVKPVLMGKAFDKAMKAYQDRLEKYEEEKNAQLAGKGRRRTFVTRILGIQRFGLYNCDRIYNAESALLVDATINTGDPVFDKSDDRKVFLITGGSRTVYRLDKNSLRKMRFVPRDDNALLVVMPDNRVAVFSNDDFRSIDQGKLSGEGKYEFNLKVMPQEIANADDLRKITGS